MSSALSDMLVPEAQLPTSVAHGHLISGTVHKPFRLGQRLSADDLADDMEMEDGPITIGRKFGGTHAAARRQGGPGGGSGGPGAGTGVRGGASLWDLVQAGVLVPGSGRISVTYKGMTASATLTEDGCIEYQGRKYQSATAFSIHFKRTITPSKQGDDGWKSVLYDGKPLEHYRAIHSQQQRQRMMAAATAEGSSADAAVAGATSQPASAPETGGGETASEAAAPAAAPAEEAAAASESAAPATGGKKPAGKAAGKPAAKKATGKPAKRGGKRKGSAADEGPADQAA